MLASSVQVDVTAPRVCTLDLFTETCKGMLSLNNDEISLVPRPFARAIVTRDL